MNKIYIDVYADSTGLFTEEFLNHLYINMITLEISREIAFDFFKQYSRFIQKIAFSSCNFF